jgi:hypothetical protein
MWYEINFNRLGVLMLPTFLRKPLLVAYLQSLLVPIVKLHYEWKLQREREGGDWYKINHTGQVCSLRKVLNDALDPFERRIYIGEGNAFPRKYIYTRAENKPVFLGKMFIYQHSEYLNTGADFIVFVPASIVSARLNEIHGYLKFYKLASKRYQIREI